MHVSMKCKLSRSWFEKKNVRIHQNSLEGINTPVNGTACSTLLKRVGTKNTRLLNNELKIEYCDQIKISFLELLIGIFELFDKIMW